MNKKALSPVIATVILMLMTVAAVGGAYHWMTTTQSDIQSGISASISAQTKRGKYTIKLVGLRCYDDRIIADIQNLGPDPISNSDVTISVYNYTSGALITSGITNISSLGVNDINSTQYIFYTPLKPDTRYSVKISIGGVSEVSDSCYTIGRLVGLWHFDEGSGSYANDSSGYGNNGTLYDANITNDDGDTPPQWVDGKYGKALSFDGVDDYVEVTDSDSLDLVDEFTISLRSYIESEKYSPLIIKGRENPAYDNYLLLEDTGRGEMYFYIGDETNTISKYISCPYTIKQWQFWTAVYERPNMYLYLNGELVDSRSDADFTVTTNTHPVKIGSKWGTVYFNGIIDEVRIYNQALTADEIRAEYEQFK